MIVSISVLGILGVAFLIPNYLAIRYALLDGGNRTAVAGAVAMAPATAVKTTTSAIYAWKALSPLLFATSVIIGLALGDVVGAAIVILAFANLLFGLRGWGK